MKKLWNKYNKQKAALGGSLFVCINKPSILSSKTSLKQRRSFIMVELLPKKG